MTSINQPYFIITAGLIITGFASAKPVREDVAQAQMAKSWGILIDPDRDCKLSLEGAVLRIKIPGKPHTMSAELAKTNAPRVMRDVEGDFGVEVRVSGQFPADNRSIAEGRWAFYGAGLLVWQDDKNYVRFERARMCFPNGEWRCYPNWELRQDGKKARDWSFDDGDLDDSKPMWFRLARKQQTLNASFSQDGKTWQQLPAITVQFPAKVKVGVIALQNTAAGYEAMFQGLSVENKKAK